MIKSALYGIIVHIGRFVFLLTNPIIFQTYIMKKIFLLSAFLLGCHLLFGQTKLPLIKANNASVTIKDDTEISKNSWTLSPEAKPDIYVANRTRSTKTVTFYTDLDSISFKIKPNSKFDFIILLHGKDSCFTQIRSAIQESGQKKKSHHHPFAKPDTIPFILTPFNNIIVKTIINQSDTLNLMFHTAVTALSLTKEGLEKTSLKMDGKSVVKSWGGATNAEYRNFNSIQIGELKWDSLRMTISDYSGQGSDGKFGYDLFKNKVLEINYDKNIMVAHHTLPKSLKGYSKLPLAYISGSFFIKADVEVAKRTYKVPFMFHSGYGGSLILSNKFIEENGLEGKLDTVGVQLLKDSYGNTIKNIIARVPSIKVGKSNFNDLSIGLMAKGASQISSSIFGNDLLKRFNVVIDFPNDYIYLKSNGLMPSPFKKM